LAPLVSFIIYGATITSFLTAFYMTRSFAMTFLGSYRGSAHPHESPALMTVPLLVLALLSLIGGLWLEHPFAEYLVPVLGPANTMAGEGLITSLMHSWIGTLGVVLGLLMYTTWSDLPAYCARVFAPITALSRGKFFFDEVYDVLIVRPLKSASSALWSIVDQGIVDLLVVMIAKSVDAFGFLCSRTQTGQLQMYALGMLVSALVLTGLYIAL
jgi:NADH-quinone oxidoreductase subunit L